MGVKDNELSLISRQARWVLKSKKEDHGVRTAHRPKADAKVFPLWKPFPGYGFDIILCDPEGPYGVHAVHGGGRGGGVVTKSQTQPGD